MLTKLYRAGSKLFQSGLSVTRTGAVCTLLMAALAVPAAAWGQGWNLYNGYTASYTVPYVTPFDTALQNNGSLQFNVSLNGSRPYSFTMDTGSTGMAVDASDIPNAPGSGPAGWIYYNSSRLLLQGYYTTVTLGFPGAVASGGAAASATATTQVLAVTSRTCLGGGADPCNPAGPVFMLGVGVDRNTLGVGTPPGEGGTPDAQNAALNAAPPIAQSYNPFLNVNGMQSGQIRSGFIITPQGVDLGLTAANTSGNFAYEQLTPLTVAVAGNPGSQANWEQAEMAVSVNSSPYVAGHILMDTGLNNGFLGVPGEPTSGTVANGTEISLQLLNANGNVGYSYMVGGSDPQEPASLGWVSNDGVSSFLNSTLKTYAGFNYLYDAAGGFIGLETNNAIPGTNAYVTPVLSAAGTLTLTQNALINLPVFISASSTVATTATAIFAAPITGPGSFAVDGTGTVQLDAANHYAGGTTVQQGTLILDGSMTGPVTVNTGGLFEVNGLLASSGLVVAAGGTLHGTGTINAPTNLAGTLSPGNSPGTLTFNAPVTLASGADTVIDIDGSGTGTGAGNYSRIIVQGAGDHFAAAGQLTPLLRGISGSANNMFTPVLGQSFTIIEAAGGITGGFAGITQPASGLPAGTRFDLLYTANTANLVVTPSQYGDLAAAGLAESSTERAVGAALDAARPAAGVPLTAALAAAGPGVAADAVYGTLYTLPVTELTPALDELAPSIYADALVTGRNAWYLASEAVDAQLAARRGLAPGQRASSAAGPGGGTIWMTGLANYNSTSTGAGALGFTSGLGGAAAGVDVPLTQTLRTGFALATADGQTWTQSGGTANTTAAQLFGYGQWQNGGWFVATQLAGMFQQETISRPQPIFGVSAKGSTNGLAGGGSLNMGIMQQFGAWLLEPHIGIAGFNLHQGDLTESSGGALAQSISGQSIASAQSTLGASAQRSLALSRSVVLVAQGQLGWAYEFADNRAAIRASFAGLNNSGYALSSAPIGRDTALIGLRADFHVTTWPATLFIGYNGAVNTSSSAQAFNAGFHVVW